MQFRNFHKNRLSTGEQFFFWLLLVGPLAPLYFLLGRGLGAAAEEIRWLIFFAWAMTAIFAGLTLQISGENVTGKAEKKNSGKLWVAGLLPSALLATIALLEWEALGQYGSGRALLVVAAALAMSNGFCWFFAHFGAQELGRQEAPKSFARHPALHINPGGSGSARYGAPWYLLLATLLMAGFFLFAFLLRPAKVAALGDSLPALGLIGFVFSFFALLGLNRFQTLLFRAKAEHVGRAGLPSLEEGGLFVLGTILLGFLAAASPLERMVKWGERLRLLKPPRIQAESLLSQNQLGAAGGLGQSGGGLIGLLLLLLFALMAIFFGQKLSRIGFWKKIKIWLMAASRKLLALLKKLFSSPEKRVESGSHYSAACDPTQTPFDVFENPELLSRLSPAQIIMATYHLVLHWAGKQGWLSGCHPPLETLSCLTVKGRLDPENMALLTWLYIRAAYSPRPPRDDEIPRAKQAWEKLKPRLLEQARPAEEKL